MTFWQAALLGIVQGATEFLPVSSSGHLILLQQLLGIDAHGITLEVTAHLGTLGAVLVVYRADLLRLLRRPAQERALIGALLIATLPVAVAGFLLKASLLRVYESLTMTALGWLVTGGLLWWAQRRLDGQPPWAAQRRVTLFNAIWIGCFQALALLPGISRSGSTLSAAIAAGIEVKHAARFVFLLSIPAIAGAALLDGIELLAQPAPVPWATLLAVFCFSFLAGWLAILGLLQLLGRGRLFAFALYCWVLALFAFFLA